MRARIDWADPVRDLFLELPERQRELIDEKLGLVASFPRMYPVRSRGRFRGHRWFQAADWLVFYRVAGNTVYIRGLWPARIP